MADVQRILDANANRAREAMRVMEEAARFVLDDADLSRRCKQLRHDLAAAMGALPAQVAVELHRDTPGDVGTAISTDAEQQRQGVADVVIAAGKRLSEALRCLAEYGKTLGPGAERFTAAIESLRYSGYAIESALHHRLGAGRPRQWRLCVLITESLCAHHGWLDVAKASLDAGADCLQLREKELNDTELFDRASQLVALAAQARDAASPKGARPQTGWRRKNTIGAPFTGPSVIINDRSDVALAGGADGVHLGQHDLPVAEVRRLVGRRLLVGVSTHNLAEARGAVAGGADYCGVGAMFASTTKRRRPAGISYLKKFVERYPQVPHLAIGGITPDNIAEVVAAGARGVAVSACVCGARNPAAVVRRLLRQIPKQLGRSPRGRP